MNKLQYAFFALLILFTNKSIAEKYCSDASGFNFRGICSADTNLLAPRDAYFPGGEIAFISFLHENFNKHLSDSIGITGTIYAEFLINETGIVSACQIKKSLHPLLDCELRRVIMSSPQWVPAVCIPAYIVDPHENPGYVESYVYCKQKLIIPFKIDYE